MRALHLLAATTLHQMDHMKVASFMDQTDPTPGTSRTCSPQDIHYEATHGYEQNLDF